MPATTAPRVRKPFTSAAAPWPQRSTAEPGGRNAHRALAILLPIAFLLYTYRLGARDFWTPIEGRTAVVAREMLATGDWLVPRVGGFVYAQKPPLYHWMVAVCFWLSGAQTEAMARFPAAVAGVFAIALLYGLGHALGGARLARTAAAITAVSVLFAWQARMASVEVLLSAWIVLAFWAFYRATQGRRWYFAIFHTALGLAIMTKGFVGPLIVGLSLAVWLVWERRLHILACREFWLTAPLAVLIGAPWYLYLTWAVPTAGHELLLAGTFQSVNHHQPAWFYLLRIPLHFQPMILALPWALALPWKRPDAGAAVEHAEWRSAVRFAFCWFTVPLAMFTLWPSKQGHYLVPLAPAAGLLVAMAFETGGTGKGFWSVNLRENFAKLAAWLVPACCAIAAPVVSVTGDGGWLLFATAAALTLVSLAVRAAPAFRRRFGGEVALAEFALALLVIFGHLAPEENAEESHQPFLSAVERLVPPEQSLSVHLQPEDLFYLHRPVKAVAPAMPWFGAEPDGGYVILKRRKLRDLPDDAYVPVLRSDQVSRNADLVLVQRRDGRRKE